jgi:hypothetical protein
MAGNKSFVRKDQKKFFKTAMRQGFAQLSVAALRWGCSRVLCENPAPCRWADFFSVNRLGKAWTISSTDLRMWGKMAKLPG